MDSAVARHKVKRLVHDGQSLLEALLFEQGRAHVIVGESNLHCHLVFEPFTVHELGATLQIAQCLIVVVALSMNGSAKEEQLGHVVEELETLADQLKCEVAIAFEDRPGSLLIELFGPWLLNRQELDHFVVVWIDGMRLPEHLVALLDLINTPKQLAFEDQYLDVLWVFLLCNFKLSKGQVFVCSSDIGQGFEVNEFHVFSLNRGH